jgi:hypothetical protein
MKCVFDLFAELTNGTAVKPDEVFDYLPAIIGRKPRTWADFAKKHGHKFRYQLTEKIVSLRDGIAASQRRRREGHRHRTQSRNVRLPLRKTLGDVVVLSSDSGDLAAAQTLGGEIGTFADHLDGVFLNAGISDLRTLRRSNLQEL